MNIAHLEYFLEVAKLKSFTKASKNLYVCQSTLSKAVQQFENELNLQLIDRTSKSFKLTEKGEILLEKGTSSLKNIHEIFDRLNESLSLEKGTINIGIPPVISTIYFTRIAHIFSSMYKNINLNILEVGANIVKDSVEKDLIDIGVVILPFNSYNFKKYSVFISDCIVVVSKHHSFANWSEISISDLRNENFILLNESYMLHDKILEYCNDAGFDPNITLKSSQWDYIVELVSLNHGITILPRLIVKKYNSQNIRLIKIKNPEFPWNIALIVKKNKYISNPMQLFLNLCEEEKEKYFSKL
ncbi:MAG: LysR family transcriptional regulator [Fusobacteriaceae bacterium]|jgi:DNA-binding transcriptional LysR family regulator|nr:LysR family transcriptional regulator [Fusobacteriaceae bacterium]